MAGPGRPVAASSNESPSPCSPNRVFDATTVEQISERAGVSRRTFFRYFDSKAAVLWSEFDHEVETLHQLLRETAPQLPMAQAIRQAVLQANHYGVDDVAELRTRMHVISTVPALGASATVHYDAGPERWPLSPRGDWARNLTT